MDSYNLYFDTHQSLLVDLYVPYKEKVYPHVTVHEIVFRDGSIFHKMGCQLSMRKKGSNHLDVIKMINEILEKHGLTL